MTDLEKDNIIRLSKKGFPPTEIAEILNIPRNTIKSYLRRTSPAVENRICLDCGSVLTFVPHKKKKKFCSDHCRMHYWNTHPQEMNLTNATTIQCEVCGKDVLSYRKKPRRFCSRACAVKGRACHE